MFQTSLLSSLPSSRLLNRRDVDLLHCHHRFEGTLGDGGVGIADGLGQGDWRDLWDNTVPYIMFTIAGLASLPTALLLLLIVFLLRTAARIYKNTALVPAIVVSERPLQAVALANMSTGLADKDFIAVRRMDLEELPEFSTTPGTRFPCIATFREGEDEDRWGNFHPEPLSYGTGDRELLAARQAKIDPKWFEMLSSWLKNNPIPTDDRKATFLN